MSVMLKVPVRVPEAVGVNVILTVQLAPTATEPPQVLVSAKSPEAEILEMVRAALPVLETVTVCAALVVPTVWLAKVRVDGVTVAVVVGATPVPVSVTV